MTAESPAARVAAMVAAAAGDLMAFFVHPVLVHQLGGDRRTCRADVQGDRGALDATRREGRAGGVEMQPGGRRGDGAGPFGEDRLVALAIVGLVGPM
jgi:hypothetical protein